MDICVLCGRDLDLLGKYKEFDHYRPGTRSICMPVTDEEMRLLGWSEEDIREDHEFWDPIIEPLARELSEQMSKTLDRLVQFPLDFKPCFNHQGIFQENR